MISLNIVTARKGRMRVLVALFFGYFGLMTMPARAEDARAEWTSYLRAGPGLKFAVLDEIAARDPLDVRGCSGGWCRIHTHNATGYVEQALVAPNAGKQAAPPTGARANCFDTILNGYRGGSNVRFCGR